MKTYFALLFVALIFLSCKKKGSQNDLDQKIITDYIAANKLNATATGSGLYYVITTQGTGVQPNVNSNVKVIYKGTLKDGTLFDQSPTGGTSFNLSQVIKGWTEGMQLFKKGGKGILLIPSVLGYGSQVTGSIPANSVLIFDVTLVDVN